MDLFDITIIGAGPVGLFTAFYAHLRSAKVKLIDSLEELGGQPGTLYPEKAIFDIPAYPELTGADLVQQLTSQLNRFETTICLGENIQDIQQADGHFVLTSNRGTHYSKAVILATGNGSFKPRTLALEGMDSDNVHYYVKHLSQYANQDLVVLGGGDSAVDWALTFDKLAASTTLVHRRPQFRAMEHSVAQLMASGVTIKTPFVPKRLVKEGNRVTQIVLEEVKTKEETVLNLDHLFVNYGFSSSRGNLTAWPVETDHQLIRVDSKQETSTPGIFAVGDCCTYPGKVALIASGFGEAPTAVNNAMHFIHPDQKVQPMHSSSLLGGH